MSLVCHHGCIVTYSEHFEHHYYDLDIDALLIGYRLMEKVVGAMPLKDLIERQTLPPAVLVEDSQVIE